MFKRIPSFCALIAVSCFLCCCVRSSEQRQLRPDEFPVKPLHYSIQQPQRTVLDNGMVLYLLEDHELPLIEVSALIRTGAVYDPSDRAGLAALTGEVMRSGGTDVMSAQVLDENLEFMDAVISVSIEAEAGNASLSVLKKDFDPAFSIFSQILRHPAFAGDRLAIAREQKLSALRQIEDNPQSLAFRKFKNLLYRSNPRGNLPTVESVRRISRRDLVDFHKTYFHPERIILGISGDFSSPEMIAKIKRSFAGWKPAQSALPPVQKPQSITAPSRFYLQKNVPQSTIILGHLAPEKSSPDYHAFEVLNYILGGGGFSSRLTSEIRSTRGLAYSVGSFYRADVDYGVFGAYCMTKSSSAHKALTLMIDIISSMKESPLQKELEQAKDALINSFVFSYSSSAQIVNQQMIREYEHLPPDFIEQFPVKIKNVTLPDLQRVAATWLHPARSVILVVGNAHAFDVPLGNWGPMQEVFSGIQN
jgi:zinc protease